MTPSIVAVELSGGLGNQLFQYAAGLSLARRHNAQLVLDTSLFKRRREPRSMALGPFAPEAKLGLARMRFSPAGDAAFLTIERSALGREVLPLSVFCEASYDYDLRFAYLGPEVLLRGYWQSHRYFDSVAGELREAAKSIIPGLDSRNRTLLDQIKSRPAIGVHIRRGDYLQEPYRSVHGACNLAYYRENMERVRLEMPDCTFYLFSDDPGWCRSALGDQDAVIVAHNGPNQAHFDLILMAACRRHIISNSSLGWWAAYLADRRGHPTIAPVPWFRNRSATPDLYPPEWDLRSRETNEPVSVVAEKVAATRVSVVIPARNRAGMLKQAIDSVLSQTKRASEIIIVLNDASPACTALAHELAGQNGVRVVAIAEANLAKARNVGIRAATGDWIAFLDDDDMWVSEKLERQLTAALSLNVGVISCDFVTFNQAGDLPGPGLRGLPAGLSLAEALVLGNYVSGGSAAIARAEVLRKSGGFDEGLLACEDLDLWRRLSWNNEIVVLSDKLVRIRRHDGQMSGSEVLMRHARRALFAKMRTDTPAEMRYMLFPVGLFYWHKGWGLELGDLFATIPAFLAKPSMALKLTLVAARSIVEKDIPTVSKLN